MFISSLLLYFVFLYLQGDLSAQGELLLQGSFSVWSSSKRERLLRLKPSQRHIFLYEKALIFCKHSKPQAHDKATYHFKRYLKVSFNLRIIFLSI